MYLLIYSLLISSALILAIFFATFLSDRQLSRRQKTGSDKKNDRLAESGVKEIEVNNSKAEGYLGGLSVGIQEF